MTVVAANHYARIVFWHLNTNLATDCHSDSTGSIYSFLSNSCYSWDPAPDPNSRYYITPPAGISSPMLEYVFRVPAANKPTNAYWQIFLPHYLHFTDGDSLLEDYNLMIFKPPYFQWKDPTTARMESLKVYVTEIRDTLANHPEAPFAFANGTPLIYYNEGGDNDFDQDSSLAKIVYAWASWFADTFDVSAYSNISKWDSYRPLIETSADSITRYSLKTSYHDTGQGGSHLNLAGRTHAESTLVDFIRGATQTYMDSLWGDAEPAAPATVDSLAYFSADSLSSDYSAELDSVRLIFEPQTEGDTFVVCISTSAYPDSTGTRRIAIAAPSTRDTLDVTVNGTESYTGYFSAWLRDSTGAWSVRKQRSITFAAASPPAATNRYANVRRQ
jgi:hypothetical protein